MKKVLFSSFYCLNKTLLFIVILSLLLPPMAVFSEYGNRSPGEEAILIGVGLLMVVGIVMIIAKYNPNKDYTAYTGSSSRTSTYDPPPPSPKITYDRGRPYVYGLDYIRRIALLSFGDDEFTDELSEKMMLSHWQVIDRFYLESILKEQNLQLSGLIDEATAVNIGKIAGVDMIIMGTYRGSSVAVKAIDVETAEYLAFENLDLYGGNSLSFNAGLASTVLLPYTKKYKDGELVMLWVGHTGDSLNNK